MKTKKRRKKRKEKEEEENRYEEENREGRCSVLRHVHKFFNTLSKRWSVSPSF
jgi:hypothetical protein